jgi:methyltransferase family protein
MSSSTLKKTVSVVPILGPVLKMVYRYYRRNVPFEGSSAYWEKRYAGGGNSGAGSYGRLAEVKAEVLNFFIQQHGIRTVIELGCGDGAQLTRAKYPLYVGVDVSVHAIAKCRMRYVSDNTKSFYHISEKAKYEGKYDAAISLDVIYHLIEEDVYQKYMSDLFTLADRYVIIYSSNYDSESAPQHIRHRKFSRWIGANAPEWQLAETISNRYPFDPQDEKNTSFADFYIYERYR